MSMGWDFAKGKFKFYGLEEIDESQFDPRIQFWMKQVRL